MEITLDDGEIIDHEDLCPLDAILMFGNRAKQFTELGPDLAREEGRLDWLLSEVKELEDAEFAGDEVEVDDALVDIIWQAWGYLIKRRGITVAIDIANEVTRSNIEKVEPIGRMVRYPNSTKVGKPEGWTPPDIESILVDRGLPTGRPS